MLLPFNEMFDLAFLFFFSIEILQCQEEPTITNDAKDLLESVSSSLRQRSNFSCCISFQVSHLVQSAAFHQEHGSSDGRVLSLISLMSCTCWPSSVYQNHLQSCLVSFLVKSHFRDFSLIRSRVSLIQSSECLIMSAGT